jgi:6-phosphogluconolactonase
VTVNCSTIAYTISATVTGLANVAGLVLQNNGTDDLAVTSGGSYPFSTQTLSGATYSVTILTQPANHTCIVQNGSGRVTSANVSVSVVCPNHVLYSAQPNTVAAFYVDDTTGSLVAVSGSPFPAGKNPLSIVLAPNGKFAYAINYGDSTLSAYSIDPITGALSVIAGSPYAIGAAPLSIAITPSGNFAFVVTVASANITSFNVYPLTGALTPTAISPFAVDANATNLAIYPTGNFAYIAYSSSTRNPPSGITAYTVDSTTGGLTPIANGSISGGATANPVFDPMGKFMYVPSNPGLVWAYTVNTTTGLLSAVSGSPFTEAYLPQSLAIYPNGQFMYVPSQGADTVAGLSIDSSTGALTPITGSPFATGVNGGMPQVVALDPSGKFAYVAVDSVIVAYTINAATGALSLIQGQYTLTGGQINSFAIGSIH